MGIVYTHDTGVLDRYTAIRVTAYAMTGAAILSVAVSVPAIVNQPWAAVSWLGWTGLLYSTGLSTVFCLAVWYYAVSRMGPLKVVAYQYLVPIIAIVLAYVLWQEPFYPGQVVGGALVLLGVRFVRIS